MMVVNIIREEIQKLFGQSFYDEQELIKMPEGTGDKYAEKQWQIPDPDRKYSQQTASAVPKDDSMGELAGYAVESYNHVTKKYNNKMPIYKNPKSVKKFEPSVRAISDENGNLFVAQFDGGFVHADMQSIATYSVYDIEKNITWNRDADTNKFGFSDSAENNVKNISETIRQDVFRRVEELNLKHPEFKFVPYYLG